MRANLDAEVVELVDTLDLGSSAARRESSSLSFRTNLQDSLIQYLILKHPRKSLLANIKIFFQTTNKYLRGQI